VVTRTTIRSSLQPYLPRLTLQWLAEDPKALHRAVNGSVVFVDISGFTKLSEKLADGHADGPGAHPKRLADLGSAERLGRQVKQGPDAPHGPLEPPELHQPADGIGHLELGLAHVFRGSRGRRGPPGPGRRIALSFQNFLKLRPLEPPGQGPGRAELE
jgi:hypothetical protein